MIFAPLSKDHHFSTSKHVSTQSIDGIPFERPTSKLLFVPSRSSDSTAACHGMFVVNSILSRTCGCNSGKKNKSGYLHRVYCCLFLSGFPLMEIVERVLLLRWRNNSSHRQVDVLRSREKNDDVFVLVIITRRVE